jgi:hypothetical protein
LAGAQPHLDGIDAELTGMASPQPTSLPDCDFRQNRRDFDLLGASPAPMLAGGIEIHGLAAIVTAVIRLPSLVVRLGHSPTG